MKSNITFKRVYEYGGDCKADDTDYICGYQASNGVMIEKQYADGLNVYCWKVGEDYYDTLNAAKNAVIRQADEPTTDAETHAAQETATEKSEPATESPRSVQEISIAAFCKKYAEEYGFLRDNRDNVAGFNEALKAWDAFCESDAHKAFIREFCEYTGDYISSDREAAAFMLTLESMTAPPMCEMETEATTKAATPVSQTEPETAAAGQPAPQEATTSEDRIDALFHELVPVEGKADTVAGEIVRAVCRIGYRYSNDGDYVGCGYGKETCNPAARYLMANAGENVAEIVRCLWAAGEECGILDDGSYGDWLSELVRAALVYLDEHPELKTTPNAEDYWNYRDPNEDVDEWDDEDEDEWGAA